VKAEAGVHVVGAGQIEPMPGAPWSVETAAAGLEMERGRDVTTAVTNTQHLAAVNVERPSRARRGRHVEHRARNSTRSCLDRTPKTSPTWRQTRKLMIPMAT